MAHVLRITDGTTTINLTGGPITLQEYVPKAPDLSLVEASAWSMEDGGEVHAVTRRNVTEPVLIAIVASTNDDVREAVRGLEEMFRQAEEYQRRRVGSRVFIEFQPGSSGDVYRSELLYGKVEPSAEALGWQWLAPGVEAQITWRRRFYWEGPEVELSLANGGGSGTGGITVYNHDDTGHDNWCAITGSAVEGVLPAPIRLEITNSFNDANRAYSFFLGLNAFSTPGSFPHILEAEDVASGGSSVSDSTCSGGYRRDVTWAGDTEQEVLRWNLSAALLGAAQGNFFQLIPRFAAATGITDTWFRFKVIYQNSVVWEGEQRKPDSIYAYLLRELGSAQLPPWLTGSTSLVALQLALFARRTGGGSFSLDFVQLTPTDSYRVLTPHGYGLAYNERLVDDGIGGLLYADSGSGTARAGHYVGYGKPLHIWPGRDQRIYFLASGWTANTAEIARTMTVRVYHRPRRLTL